MFGRQKRKREEAQKQKERELKLNQLETDYEQLLDDMPPGIEKVRAINDLFRLRISRTLSRWIG